MTRFIFAVLILFVAGLARADVTLDEDCAISDTGTVPSTCTVGDVAWTSADSIITAGFNLTIPGTITFDDAVEQILCTSGSISFTEPGIITLPQGISGIAVSVSGDCALTVDADEFAQAAGDGRSSFVAQELINNTAIWELGRVIPCENGSLGIDCSVAANQQRIAIAWEDARYEIESTQPGHSNIQTALTQITTEHEWCSLTGANFAHCLDVVEVDVAGADPHVILDPNGGRSTNRAPMVWRRPWQSTLETAAAVGDRVLTVNCAEANGCGAALDAIAAVEAIRTQPLNGFQLSVYDETSEQLLSGPHVISRSTYDDAGDTVQLTILDAFGVKIDVSTAKIIVVDRFGLREGDTGYFIHRAHFTSASASETDSQIKADTTGDISIAGLRLDRIGTPASGQAAIELRAGNITTFDDVRVTSWSNGSSESGRGIIFGSTVGCATLPSRMNRIHMAVTGTAATDHGFVIADDCPSAVTVDYLGVELIDDDPVLWPADGSITLDHINLRIRSSLPSSMECFQSFGGGSALTTATVRNGFWQGCSGDETTGNGGSILLKAGDTMTFSNMVFLGVLLITEAVTVQNSLFSGSEQLNTNVNNRSLLPPNCTNCTVKDMHTDDYSTFEVGLCAFAQVDWNSVFVHDVTVGIGCDVFSENVIKNSAFLDIQGPTTVSDDLMEPGSGGTILFENNTVTFREAFVQSGTPNEIFWHGVTSTFKKNIFAHTGVAYDAAVLLGSNIPADNIVQNCMFENLEDVEGTKQLDAASIRNRTIRFRNREHINIPDLRLVSGSACAGLGAQNAGIQSCNFPLAQFGLSPENSAGSGSGGGGGGGGGQCKSGPWVHPRR